MFCQTVFREMFLRACQPSLGKPPSDLWLILGSGERGSGGICATDFPYQIPVQYFCVF